MGEEAAAAAPEELWEEILLRLPPDDPASLLHASLVCKPWRRLVSSRGFFRRLAQLHGAPPMLGFFKDDGRFVPTTACPAFSLPASERHSCPYYIDCRHGRVLLLCKTGDGLLVWEPLTGYRRCVPWPDGDGGSFNAAVVCAEDGCDHRSCYPGGPFRVVLIYASEKDVSVVSAWEYSSETGAWGEPLPVLASPDSRSMQINGSVLVGCSLYFFCDTWEIIKYDLGGQGLAAVIEITQDMADYCWGIRLMQAEDGGLGVAGVEARSSCLQLWSQQMSGEADVYEDDDYADYSEGGWVLRRTIHLKNLLPGAAFLRGEPQVLGVAEGVGVVLLDTSDGIFTIELKSDQVRKVCESRQASNLLPFVSFYTPD